MSLGFKSQSVGFRANLCDDRTVDIWSIYSRTLLDILFLIWGQTVADHKMLSFHLSINVIIIVVSFKILDLCPIALFQQLWNTCIIALVSLEIFHWLCVGMVGYCTRLKQIWFNRVFFSAFLYFVFWMILRRALSHVGWETYAVRSGWVSFSRCRHISEKCSKTIHGVILC